MKKIFLFLVFMFLTACASSNSNSNKLQYMYEFSNSSLGPINGHQKVKISIQNAQIVKAVDVKTGKTISFTKIKGSSAFLRALKHNNKDLDVTYDSSGMPVSIANQVPEGEIGGKYHITLKKIN